MSVDFPPKENANPILEGNGPNPRPSKLPVLEIENIYDRDNSIDRMVDRRLDNSFSSTSYVHNNVPMPKLEIPLFDGKKLGCG